MSNWWISIFESTKQSVLEYLKEIIPGYKEPIPEKLTPIQDFESYVPTKFRINPEEESSFGLYSKSPEAKMAPKGLSSVLRDIVHRRLVKKLKEFYKYRTPDVKGMIIICDHNTHDVLNKAVEQMTLKLHGVSCTFHLNDVIPSLMTTSFIVVYVVDIADIEEKEFQWLLDDIEKRKSHISYMFLSYVIDPFDEQGLFRLNKLGQVMARKHIKGPILLKIFDVFGRNIGLIDNCPTVGHIHNKKEMNAKVDSESSVETIYDLSDPDVGITLRIAHRLATLFSDMNVFPIVRYLRSYHNYNKFVAEYVERMLREVESLRKEAGDTRNFLKNYVLIVVDRSMDMTTPIMHSQTFQPFVTQELEMVYNTEDEQIDQNLANFRINEVTQELIRLGKSGGDELTSKEREMRSSAIRKHSEAAEKMMKKLKDGYDAFVNLEQEMIKGGKSNLKAKVKLVTQLLDKNHKEIFSFDIVRLLTIYCIATEDYALKQLKSVRKKLVKDGKLTTNEVNQITTYAEIVKSIVSDKRSPQSGSISLPQVIADAKSNRLARERFPEVGGSTSNLPANIFVFMLGGLAYSELQYTQTEPHQVILCSDSLITPRTLYECLGC